MPESFTPGPETTRAFRDALGCYATGVTIVTTACADGPIGITANSFASVSLDPPLVLWSPAKSSRRYKHFCDATHFAIHVVGSEQEALVRAFAREPHAFDGIGHTENDSGVPLIPGCLARFECETTATHDGGDHLIVVARVLEATYREGDPLLFLGGEYGHFSSEA